MNSQLFDISGRTALVTGSSQGIGYALADGLVQAGCTVVLNSRHQDTLDIAREKLLAQARDGTNAGAGVHAVAFDVTSPAEVAAGVARAEEVAGALDILVNNAGIQRRGAFVDFSDKDWDEIISTNLTAPFIVGREVARRMVTRGEGKIVNICSLQSEVSRPGIAPYAASKGALKMLTKGMCGDLAPAGIQVNGIGPGYFETALTASLVQDEKFNTWVCGRTPAGRWGQLDDLIGTLIFFCSHASDFVNGQILYVDGGMLAVL